MKKAKKKAVANVKPSLKKTGKASIQAKKSMKSKSAAMVKPKTGVKFKLKTKPAKKKSASSASVKLKKGKSVLCEFCGKPIPEERLEILPETTTCVECSQTQPYSEAEIIGFNLGENTEKEGIDMEDFDDTAPEVSPLFDN